MARIDLDHGGMAEMLKSTAMAKAMQSVAEPIKSEAKASAPVASGAYRDSIHIEPHVTSDRTSSRVVAGTDHGAEVEARTGNLARAAGAAGRP